MEPFCNPYIRLKDILKESSGDFILVDGILEEECRAIIQEGRKQLLV